MAQTKQSSQTTKSSSSKSSSFWGINKVSFYLIGAAALFYLVAMVLSAVGISLKIVSAIQGVVTAFIIAVVAVLAWRYVKNKPTVWKVLYVMFLLVVLVGIIIPLVV